VCLWLQMILKNGVDFFSGVFVWVIFSVASGFIWADKANIWSLRWAVVSLCAFSAVLIGILWVLFECCLRIEAFKSSIFGHVASTAMSSRNEDAQLGEDVALVVPVDHCTGKQPSPRKISIWPTVKKGVPSGLRAGLNLGTTLLVYPSIGPLRWPTSEVSFFIGCFVMIDAGARFFLTYFPQWFNWCSWNVVSVVIYSRPLPDNTTHYRENLLAAIPTVVALAPFLSQFPWLFGMLLLLTTTHSLCLAIGCDQHMARAVGKQESDTFGCVLTLCIVCCGFCGVMLSKIPVHLLS